MNTGKLRLWATFVVFNLFGFGMLAVAYLKGWVNMIVERDTSNICIAIAGLFLVGLAMCYARVRKLNQAFDDLASGDNEKVNRLKRLAKADPNGTSEFLKILLGRKLTWINAVLYTLPALGLLGTVVGIAMGLDGTIVVGAEKISEVVNQLFFQITNGLAIAFYTTIVGMVFMLWLYFNLKVLEAESLRLLEMILEATHDEKLAEADKAAKDSSAASGKE